MRSDLDRFYLTRIAKITPVGRDFLLESIIDAARYAALRSLGSCRTSAAAHGGQQAAELNHEHEPIERKRTRETLNRSKRGLPDFNGSRRRYSGPNRLIRLILAWNNGHGVRQPGKHPENECLASSRSVRCTNPAAYTFITPPVLAEVTSLE